MKKDYDENNRPDDDDSDEDEFAGYSITDDEGQEVEREGKKKKKISYDDASDEPVEASPIPENEQTVLIDNAHIFGLSEGDMLSLHITGEESASVFLGAEKVGDLKSAFVKKLLVDRRGWHVRCFFHSAAVPVMVRLVYYRTQVKNAVRI